jgi:hypothetical protein
VSKYCRTTHVCTQHIRIPSAVKLDTAVRISYTLKCIYSGDHTDMATHAVGNNFSLVSLNIHHFEKCLKYMFQTLMRSIYMFSNVQTLYRVSPLRKITKLNSSLIKTKLTRHVHPVAYTEFHYNINVKKVKMSLCSTN